LIVADTGNHRLVTVPRTGGDVIPMDLEDL